MSHHNDERRVPSLPDDPGETIRGDDRETLMNGRPGGGVANQPGPFPELANRPPTPTPSTSPAPTLEPPPSPLGESLDTETMGPATPPNPSGSERPTGGRAVVSNGAPERTRFTDAGDASGSQI